MINIIKNEGFVTFDFGNKTVEVPNGELYLTIDENSDVVTYRSVDGVTFVTTLIGELTVDGSAVNKDTIVEATKDMFSGGGGGSVSPEEIEKIVNENHYTKEESDAIVNDVKAVADDAKTIAESKADVAMVDTVKVIADEALAVADEAKTIAESKADVDMVDTVKVIADNAFAVADEAKTIAESKADVAMVDEAKAVADEAKTIAETKQDALVSGTNIKTINGQTLLGEGDIEIKVDAYTKEESDARYVQKEPSIPNNEIWYTTTDGLTAQTTNSTGINSLNTMGLVSNEVVGDKCVMTFSKDITSVGGLAFYSCSSLTSIELPDSVTSIGGGRTFNNCSSLTSVTIPNSVTTIASYTFDSCSNLTSIEIPDSVTSIGEYAFNGCSSLTSINIPDSVTSIMGRTFYGCSRLPSIEIPDSVTSIATQAFFGCSSLTSVIIPDSVTSIATNVFQYCTSLASVTIGNSVTKIDYYTFSNCTNLTSITIPNSVTSINSGAFGSVPTGGTLYCDEDWFNNLSDTNKTNLENVANWTRKPLPKPIEERVDVLETDVTQIKEDIKDIENRIVILTQAEYENLPEKKNDTLYFIK